MPCSSREFLPSFAVPGYAKPNGTNPGRTTRLKLLPGRTTRLKLLPGRTIRDACRGVLQVGVLRPATPWLGDPLGLPQRDSGWCETTRQAGQILATASVADHGWFRPRGVGCKPQVRDDKRRGCTPLRLRPPGLPDRRLQECGAAWLPLGRSSAHHRKGLELDNPGQRPEPDARDGKRRGSCWAWKARFRRGPA